MMQDYYEFARKPSAEVRHINLPIIWQEMST